MKTSEMLNKLDKAWQAQEEELSKQNEKRAKEITDELWKSLEEQLKPVKSGLKSYILSRTIWSSVATAVGIGLALLLMAVIFQVKKKENLLMTIEKSLENAEKLGAWREIGEIEIIDEYRDYLLITTSAKGAKAEQEIGGYKNVIMIPKRKE